MSIKTNMSTPYSRAIFSLAERDQNFKHWQDLLKMLAEAAVECEKKNILNNPKIMVAEKLELFSGVTQKDQEAVNLVDLLARAKKLNLLPEIMLGYEKLLAAYNKILEVTVVSANKLDAKHKKQLVEALEKRYEHKVLLHCHVDDKLIGGAVLYVYDKVIDCSISGMLGRLKYNLLYKEKAC